MGGISAMVKKKVVSISDEEVAEQVTKAFEVTLYIYYVKHESNQINLGSIFDDYLTSKFDLCEILGNAN